MKIKFESNNSFSTDEDVNIHLATIVIRAIFAKVGKYCPQLFLDGGLIKKLVYEGIDVSDGVDISNSKECMFCHCWYYLDKDFTYGPYLCDRCYNIMEKSIDFKNIVIVHIKKSAYRIYFLDMTKGEAKKING